MPKNEHKATQSHPEIMFPTKYKANSIANQEIQYM